MVRRQQVGELWRASAASEQVGGATATRRLVAGGAAGAIEKVMGGQEWLGHGAGIEGVPTGGMLVVKRQQVVEEGLCCLRASGSSNDSKGVGGRRSCRCYMYSEDQRRAGVAGAGIKRASPGGMIAVKRQQGRLKDVEEGLCCFRASRRGQEQQGGWWLEEQQVL